MGFNSAFKGLNCKRFSSRHVYNTRHRKAARDVSPWKTSMEISSKSKDKIICIAGLHISFHKGIREWLWCPKVRA